jgi:protein-tyrosine phosphatase
VKLKGDDSLRDDYINASYIQYNDTNIVSLPSKTDEMPAQPNLNESCRSRHSYKKYIVTQGPLPATFNDFWSILWDQRSRVIVMLTKEEEMNRVCYTENRCIV